MEASYRVLGPSQWQWQSGLLLGSFCMCPVDFDRPAEFLQHAFDVETLFWWLSPHVHSPWLRLLNDFRLGEDDLWRREEEFKLPNAQPVFPRLWWWWWRSAWSLPGSSEQLSLFMRINNQNWNSVQIDHKKVKIFLIMESKSLAYQLLPPVDWWQLLHVRLKLSLLSSMPESLDKLWCCPSFLEESPCRLQDDLISLFPCCLRFDELLGVLDLCKSPLRVADDDLAFDRLVECCLRWRISS